MSYSQPAISRDGVQLEKEYALRDVRDIIWERGEQVRLELLGEDQVTRDAFNNIIRRSPGTTESFTFYAFPIIYDPTQEQQEKAGLRESTGVIIYTAMWDWDNNSLSVDRLQDIDLTRATVIIDGAKYEIKEKNNIDQFSNTYLYIVLGLNKI